MLERHEQIIPLDPSPMVMVVDADQTRRAILTQMIRALGYHARSCPTGRAAVGFLKQHPRELIKERPDADVLDAGLIAAAQHVEHYEMAGYGTVRTWARLLGHEDQARMLQETLNEEGATDKALTQLAERINVAAETEDDD